MEEKNLFEKLVAVSPGMEIWWDSSPVIFNNWCRKMLDKAEDGDRATLQRQFDRMYDPANPESQMFRGVTTNPPLSLQAIQDDPAYWTKVAKEMIADNPGIDAESLFWKLYPKHQGGNHESWRSERDQNQGEPGGHDTGGCRANGFKWA